MTNPTSNFGWQMPTSTDLVTDLPADFEVFGQAVDTSLADLKGGTTGQVLAKASNTDMDFVWSADAAGMTNPMTTTGDTIYSSSGSTPARLGIGTTGQVLSVSGGIPAWTTPAGGGANWTLLNSGGTTLTGGSTVTVSGISSKDKIMVLVQSASTDTGQAQIAVRINGDTGYNYKPFGFYISNPSSYSANEFNTVIPNTEWIRIGTMTASAGSTVSGYVQLTGCSSSGVKMFVAGGGATPNGSTNGVYQVVGGFWDSSSSVTSVSVASGNTLDGGTVFVYTSA